MYIHPDAAEREMRCGSDLDGIAGAYALHQGVHVEALTAPVLVAFGPAGEIIDDVARQMRPRQIDPTIGAAAAFIDLRRAGCRHHIAGGQFHPFWVPAPKETLAVLIQKMGAYAGLWTDSPGKLDATPDFGRHQAAGQELQHLHLDQLGAG